MFQVDQISVAGFPGQDQTHGSPKRTSVQGHQMRVSGNASTVRRPVPGAACKLQFLLLEEIPAFLTETSSSPTSPQLQSGPTHRTTKASPTTLMSTTTLPLVRLTLNHSSRPLTSAYVPQKKPGIGAKRVLQGLSSFRNSLHLRISVKNTAIPTGHADIEVQHPSQPKSITAEKEDTCKGPKNKKIGIQILARPPSSSRVPESAWTTCLPAQATGDAKTEAANGPEEDGCSGALSLKASKPKVSTM